VALIEYVIVDGVNKELYFKVGVGVGNLWFMNCITFEDDDPLNEGCQSFRICEE